MRLSTILTGCLLLVVTAAFGQLRHEVIFKTEDGTIEAGKLRYFGLKSPDDFHIIKQIEEAHKKERIVFEPGKTLEWAVQGQDKLIKRHSYRGNKHYVQLLYTGEVQLYKVISRQFIERYFLVRENEWYHVQNSVPREAVYQILKQNCRTIHLPNRIRSPWDAIELCRQMNECLGAAEHHAYLSQWADRNELGLSYDFFANKGVNTAPYFHHNGQGIFVAHYGLETHIPPAQRKLSLTYNRRLFRYKPNILGQLNASIIGFSFTERSDLRPHDSQRHPADEHLAMVVGYLDPGLEFRTGYQKRFQFVLGFGAAFAVPLYTKCRVEQLNQAATLQGKPVFQEMRNLLETKPGYHAHFGFNINFGELDISTRIRGRHLTQEFRQWDTHNVLYSNIFPQKSRISPSYHVQLQLRLNYHW